MVETRCWGKEGKLMGGLFVVVFVVVVAVAVAVVVVIIVYVFVAEGK
jgi:uncharacterized membrane protein